MAIPESVVPLLDGLVALVRERFGDRAVAVYGLGSVAHGDWTPAASDVDVCVVLADPVGEGDGPGLVAISGELAERFPRFGPRLSLFWTSEAILRGEATGGNLGRVDATDLAQNGKLVWGRDVRPSVRALGREDLIAAMGADLNERWRQRVTPFHGREAIEDGKGGELDERTLIKACLYPARFLYTAETGRLDGGDQAVDHFARLFGEEPAAGPRLAAELRERSSPSASQDERERLARAFKPLYALFFAEISRRYGLEVPKG